MKEISETFNNSLQTMSKNDKDNSSKKTKENFKKVISFQL